MGNRFFVAVLIVWGLMIAPNARALDTSVEAGIGYDDNAAEVSGGEGAGFARYRIRLNQSLPQNTTQIRGALFMEGSYNQYLDLDDYYQFLAGGDLSFSAFQDRLRPGLFIQALAYRDELVEEDEQDRFLIGGRMEWLADARLSLTVRGSLARADYRNEVNLPGRRLPPYGRGKGPSWGRPEPDGSNETFSREDTIGTIEMGAALFPTPDLQAEFRVHHRRVDSSAVFESYRDNGVSAWVGWFPTESWELFASGAWARLDFDESPDETDRTDDLYSLGMGIRRFWGDFEIYLELDRTENDSPVDGEDYAKTVTRCGLVYSF